MDKRLMTLEEAIEIMNEYNNVYIYNLKNRIALLIRERELIIKCLKEDRIEDLKLFFNIEHTTTKINEPQ